MAAKAPPDITVVMPVYNRGSIVERAVRSVLDQDFEDFELIVIDDGSTDDTVKVVQSIDDRRLKLIRQPANAGGNAARNRGIKAARAPLISFLDSDDVYLPGKLGFIVRTFAERPELDVLLDSFAKQYPEGDPRKPVARRNPVINDTAEFLRALFNRRLWKATPAISIRREVALRAGMFDETLKRRQDFDFIIRAANTGRCASTDTVTWLKSWTEGAISDDLRTFARATIELCRRHPAYFENPEYRPGLARDVTRHFARLLGQGRFADARKDARDFLNQFSAGGFARLLAEGSRQLLSRKLLSKRSRAGKRPKGSGQRAGEFTG
jgi:glycosyltransferase involved in cell wall biosynthesis